MLDDRNGNLGDVATGQHAKTVNSACTVSDYDKMLALIEKCSTEAGHNVHFFDHSKNNGSLLLQPLYACGQGFKGPDEEQIFHFKKQLVTKFRQSKINLPTEIEVKNSRTNADHPNIFSLVIQLSK